MKCHTVTVRDTTVTNKRSTKPLKTREDLSNEKTSLDEEELSKREGIHFKLKNCPWRYKQEKINWENCAEFGMAGHCSSQKKMLKMRLEQ